MAEEDGAATEHQSGRIPVSVFETQSKDHHAFETAI